jgi:hypothetical protein
MVEDDTERVVGICLSGGGIRSAAFALGAIQALQTHLGLLNGPERARYLSAVSGGSYTAAAYSLATGGVLDAPSMRILHPDLAEAAARDASKHTEDGRAIGTDGHPVWTDDRCRQRGFAGLVDRYLEYVSRHRLSKRRERDLAEQMKTSGWTSVSPPDAAMPGKPESEFLRNHARYLAEPSGLLASGFSFLWRMALTMTMVFSSFLVIGALLGIPNRWVVVRQFTGFSKSLDIRMGTGGWSWPVLLAISGATLYVLLFVSATVRRRISAGRAVHLELTPRQIRNKELLLLGWSVWFFLSVGLFLPRLYTLALHRGPLGHGLAFHHLYLTAASVLSAAASSPILIAVVRSRQNVMPHGVAKLSTRVLDVAKTISYRLLQLVVSISVPSAVLSAFLSGWLLGATWTPPRFNITPFWFNICAQIPVWIVLGWVLIGGYLNITLFPLYRDKLSRCFDVIRQSKDDGTVLRARQRAVTPALASMRDIDAPELLICASANLSETGAAPAGALAQPIIFSPKTITMPTIDGAVFDTAALDRSVHRTLPVPRPAIATYDGTVMTCVAVTGAAVSPSMGRFTKSWLRALMGFLNLRLGIWMPNPASPAVRKRVDDDEGVPRVIPTLKYFIRELRGRHYLNSNLIYVSDGGHYENLGLVELVRRRCTEIWCIDGSGDPPGMAFALAESLTLITSELGLAADFDLSVFAISDEEPTEKDHPQIRSVHSTGIIRSLAPADEERPYECVVRVVKIGIDSTTSTRIDELRRKYRRFPYDSTFNQLYNAERFDMYRDLGFDSTSRAIRAKIAENSCTTSDLTDFEEPSDRPGSFATEAPRGRPDTADFLP